MAHDLQMQSEDAHGVTFVCSVCAAVIEFVKPEFGAPNPVLIDGAWKAPENPEQWMGECE